MNAYDEVLAYLPLLEDHGQWFCYYGEPKDEYYYEYEAQDETGKHLVLSFEFSELLETAAADFEEERDWKSIFKQNGLDKDQLFTYDPNEMNAHLVKAAILELADSLSENDQMIDALRNGYFLRLMKRLKQLGDSSLHLQEPMDAVSIFKD